MRLCKGKVSVVFEDLQSQPITEFHGRRVFPKRQGDNLCNRMIDCPQNPQAQLKCLLSDSTGAKMAKTHRKGYLYRCHQGKGFPNFLFPIMIWPEEVVGYLYVGQFVFQELDEKKRAKFLKQLKESDYIIPAPDRFISEWSYADRRDFYEYIITPKRLRKIFPYDEFEKILLSQIKNYGVSPEEFFDIIEHIEGLAEYLSKVGNSLYLLTSLVEIERRLSPFGKARYDLALSELRDAIASAVTKNNVNEIDVEETLKSISERSVEILMGCKDYEDKYIKEMIKPYELGIVKPTDEVQRWIIEYYIRSLTFEVILYSKLREALGYRRYQQEFRNLLEGGQEVMSSFFNVLASCGEQFSMVRELVKESFPKLYREKEVKFLLRPKFVPCTRLLFDHESDLKKWIVDNGITDIDIDEYPEKIVSFSRTFDLITSDFESIRQKLKNINQSLSMESKKSCATEFVDIGELSVYLQKTNNLRKKLAREFDYDRFGTRKCLDLKSHKVFLNSGGLTSTHVAALNEEKKWVAYRNEEGPIGVGLEEELTNKIERARDLVRNYIGVETSDCIIFTHNTTSSIDLVLRSLLRWGDKVVTTDLEHDVIYALADHYKRNRECTFKFVEISRKLLEGQDWLSMFTDEIGVGTRLVIVSHILFSTGKILPVKEIIRKCQEVTKDPNRKVFVLIDGAHAVGNIEVDVSDLGCDFYAFDGHKWLLGPEGTGMLYCKEEYLKPDNSYGIHFPFSTAFMTSPKYAPKKIDGRSYELGTMDVTRLIGLGATIEATAKLKFSMMQKWRKHLVREFSEAIKNTQWKIINLDDAMKTGMLCLQIQGEEENEKYRKIVALLEERNVIVRALDKPPCIRLCIHHYNNETDIEIAAFHLKALIEGENMHIGNQDKIKVRIKETIRTFLETNNRNMFKPDHVGLNLFSIPGSGKTHVISQVLQELKEDGTIADFWKIRAKDTLKLENRQAKFASIVEEAWKKQPSAIFLDEADSLLEEKQSGILGMFNDESGRIVEDNAKIVFITAENRPKDIAPSASRRLTLAYFPLPDFKTRLSYLRKLSEGVDCSSKLLLTQIARLTRGYTMSNLKELWKTCLEKAQGGVIRPEHFDSSLESVKTTASTEILKKYTRLIMELRPELYTGEVQI